MMDKKIKIIGLTGGTGSGKSSVARILENHGGYIIDADKISREIMVKGQPAYEEVIIAFGNEIADLSHEIDRKKLAEIVFSDPAKRKLLEAITHKYILVEMKDRISQIRSNPAAYKFIVLDAPLLIESGLHKDVDMVWLMRADDETRQKRVIARDSISLNHAVKRMASQPAFDELRIYADEVIVNEGDFKSLETRVGELLSQIGE